MTDRDEPRAWWHAAVRAWARHPRWSLALRGAVAAVLAWWAAAALPAPWNEYPAFGPLGAVVATTSTLARSVRESVQAVVALLLGSAVALAVGASPLPGFVQVLLVVATALLLAGWHRLGAMGAWVVFSAIFVLVLGTTGDTDYAQAYVGLVVLGAGIGLVVNLVASPLPLTPSEESLDRLRDAVANQLDDLADHLEGGEGLDTDPWDLLLHEVRPALRRAEAAVDRAQEAARANPRRGRYRTWRADLVQRAAALLVSAEVVEGAVRLLAGRPSSPGRGAELPDSSRPGVVRTLRAYAAALVADDDGAEGSRDRLAGELASLRARLADTPGAEPGDVLVAGTLVVMLERGAAALVPDPEAGLSDRR